MPSVTNCMPPIVPPDHHILQNIPLLKGHHDVVHDAGAQVGWEKPQSYDGPPGPTHLPHLTGQNQVEHFPRLENPEPCGLGRRGKGSGDALPAGIELEAVKRTDQAGAAHPASGSGTQVSPQVGQTASATQMFPSPSCQTTIFCPSRSFESAFPSGRNGGWQRNTNPRDRGEADWGRIAARQVLMAWRTEIL